MKRLILAGGGHAHLHVLKALAAHAWPAVEVILISPHERQVYSGMLPGWIAGHYRLEACVAELLPLVRAAGVRFMHDSVIGLDARRRIVRCAKSGDIAYDLLSLDVGAQVDVSTLAATDAALLPIRPIERFIVDWSHQLQDLSGAGRARIAVAGGGAAGVELALAIRHRLTRAITDDAVEVFLIEGRSFLRGHGQGVAGRLAQVLKTRGVARVPGLAVGTDGGLLLEDGRRLEVDCVVAATGVSPPAWLDDSHLALAQDGFVAVGDGQQSISHANVFAGGDVASRVDKPHAKSGVYAVRSGPALAQNLERFLAGQAIQPYRPQRRSLYLLATGPKHAIASWGSLSVQGAWVWRWKNWIDRRFMKQYDLAKGVRDEPAKGHQPSVGQ